MPTISVHVDDAIYQEVRALADQLDRSQSWAVGDALQPYLDHHRRMIEETTKTLADVRSRNAKLRDHDDVAADILDCARKLDACE